MIRVTFDPGELAIIRSVALWRRSVNEIVGVKERLVAQAANAYRTLDDEIVGVMAEYAFAKMMNVCPDFGCRPRRGSCDAIFNGRSVDVKAVPKRHYDLKTPVKAHAHADIFVLGVVVDNNAVEIVGWATRDELINDANIKDFGYGPSYALPQDCLHRSFPTYTDELVSEQA